MVLAASRFLSVFRWVPLLAIAGLAAVLAGLPSAAGATFLAPPDFSRDGHAARDGLSSRDLCLNVTDFRAEFFARVARNFDFDFPGTLPPFDGFAEHPWTEGFLGEKARRIASALTLRHFCRRDPPPTIIPEPGTALLVAGGLAALSFVGRKRRG